MESDTGWDRLDRVEILCLGTEHSVLVFVSDDGIIRKTKVQQLAVVERIEAWEVGCDIYGIGKIVTGGIFDDRYQFQLKWFVVRAYRSCSCIPAARVVFLSFAIL